MKWKINKCGFFVNVLVGGLTYIVHRQIEEVLRFQNISLRDIGFLGTILLMVNILHTHFENTVT